MAETSLARQRANSTEDAGVYVYPHPLSLARSRAEAERALLADREDYGELCRSWGRLGGLATFFKYGRRYYRLLAKVRWGDPSASVELAAHVDKRRS